MYIEGETERERERDVHIYTSTYHNDDNDNDDNNRNINYTNRYYRRSAAEPACWRPGPARRAGEPASRRAGDC